MIGPCAKKVVTATIVTAEGHRLIGRNDCRNPQYKCPRLPNEGLEKCKLICDQPGHAEVMAVTFAKEHNISLEGAEIYIEGISWACRDCQEFVQAAGIKTIHFKPVDG